MDLNDSYSIAVGILMTEPFALHMPFFFFGQVGRAPETWISKAVNLDRMDEKLYKNFM